MAPSAKRRSTGIDAGRIFLVVAIVFFALLWWSNSKIHYKLHEARHGGGSGTEVARRGKQIGGAGVRHQPASPENHPEDTLPSRLVPVSTRGPDHAADQEDRSKPGQPHKDDVVSEDTQPESVPEEPWMKQVLDYYMEAPSSRYFFLYTVPNATALIKHLEFVRLYTQGPSHGDTARKHEQRSRGADGASENGDDAWEEAYLGQETAQATTMTRLMNYLQKQLATMSHKRQPVLVDGDIHRLLRNALEVVDGTQSDGTLKNFAHGAKIDGDLRNGRFVIRENSKGFVTKVTEHSDSMKVLSVQQGGFAGLVPTDFSCPMLSNVYLAIDLVVLPISQFNCGSPANGNKLVEAVIGALPSINKRLYPKVMVVLDCPCRPEEQPTEMRERTLNRVQSALNELHFHGKGQPNAPVGGASGGNGQDPSSDSGSMVCRTAAGSGWDFHVTCGIVGRTKQEEQRIASDTMKEVSDTLSPQILHECRVLHHYHYEGLHQSAHFHNGVRRFCEHTDLTVQKALKWGTKTGVYVGTLGHGHHERGLVRGEAMHHHGRIKAVNDKRFVFNGTDRHPPGGAAPLASTTEEKVIVKHFHVSHFHRFRGFHALWGSSVWYPYLAYPYASCLNRELSFTVFQPQPFLPGRNMKQFMSGMAKETWDVRVSIAMQILCMFDFLHNHPNGPFTYDDNHPEQYFISKNPNWSKARKKTGANRTAGLYRYRPGVDDDDDPKGVTAGHSWGQAMLQEDSGITSEYLVFMVDLDTIQQTKKYKDPTRGYRNKPRSDCRCFFCNGRSNCLFINTLIGYEKCSQIDLDITGPETTESFFEQYCSPKTDMWFIGQLMMYLVDRSVPWYGQSMKQVIRRLQLGELPKKITGEPVYDKVMASCFQEDPPTPARLYEQLLPLCAAKNCGMPEKCPKAKLVDRDKRGALFVEGYMPHN